jgi:hypothetical protein
MTIGKFSVLHCDSCESHLVVERPDPSGARIEASRKGWKFMTYQGFVIAGRNRARQWDCCPTCDLPEPAVVMEKLTEELAAKKAADGT